MNRHTDLVKSLCEMRDACAAAMRVLGDHELSPELVYKFQEELERVGVKDGFGARANELLRLEQMA